jgi:hypothetical protein
LNSIGRIQNKRSFPRRASSLPPSPSGCWHVAPFYLRSRIERDILPRRPHVSPNQACCDDDVAAAVDDEPQRPAACFCLTNAALRWVPSSVSSSVNGRRHRPLFFLLLWGIGFSNRIVTIARKDRHGGAPSPPPRGPLPHIEIETESSQAKPSQAESTWLLGPGSCYASTRTAPSLFPSAVRFARPPLACLMNEGEEGRAANAGAAADGARAAAVAPEGIVFRSAIRREDENPAAIEGRDEDGWNVLHCAACYGATLEGGGAPHPAAAREPGALRKRTNRACIPYTSLRNMRRSRWWNSSSSRTTEALFEKGRRRALS